MDQPALSVMQVVILLLLVLTSHSQKHTFFIKSTNTSHCPSEANASQCYDLYTFVSGKHWLSAPNTTLLFLPGEHFLELDLDVRNTEEFRMIPYIQSNESSVRICIICTSYGQTIHFQKVSSVKVDSISFLSCGVDDGSSGALQLRSVYHSEITNSKWYESRSSAIFIQDSNTVVADCQFLRGNCSDCSGGGIQAETSNVTFTGSNVVSEISTWAGHGGGLSLVESSVFLDGNLMIIDNVANTYMHKHSEGGGMYLYDCMLTVTNTSFLLFENNSADLGGGLYLSTVTASIAGTTIFAKNSAKYANGGGSYFFNSYCHFAGNTLYDSNEGGGLITVLGYLAIEHVNFTKNSAVDGGAIASIGPNNVLLGKTRFTNNSAEDSGGSIFMYESSFVFTGYVIFSANTANDGGGIACYFHSECMFESTALFSGNNANNSGGILRVFAESNVTFLSDVNISTSSANLAGGSIIVEDDSLLVMNGDVHINDSRAFSYGGAIALDRSALRMEGNSEITGNRAEYGGAIHAIASKLFFTGNHSINSNYAQFGGGFSLSDGSIMHFSAQMYLQLTSNYAYQYGGAFWVEDVPFYTCTNENNPVRKCFYQEFSGGWLRVEKDLCVFKNNTAAIAGSNIYGGNVLNCIFFEDSKQALSKEQFEELFSLVNESTNSSPISSDPIRVCLCTQYNEPDCSISSYTVEAFSGQHFPLTLVGVGQRNGTVPAVILSHTDPPSSDTVKTSGNSCSTLFYKVSSDSPSVTLMLYPDSPCNSISLLTVTVNIKPCPPGFMLHNETRSCTCDDTMKKLDIQCDINSQSFAHKHGVWVDYNQFNEHNSTVIYHTHCPFGYCLQELSNFTFNNTDNQCRCNRSGLICGACKEGYSLTLGGSMCAQCSHVFLLVFLPLAVAGVILVLFLLAFRLTVAMGTINGLIFFANIIGSNSSIFLPPESNVVLRVFIAWLNLDLGISTCLFDGLNMYTRVWLQFIFPFYVFLLTGMIITISHYSTLLTRFLGSDPVAVLATLILLAYTKLFRAVLTVMSFTYIHFSDGSRIAVWLYDGNVGYLSGKHIPLFIYALLIFLLLIVPYTMILLFAPCLLRCSQNRFLFWIDDHRLKPFLFSYYVPLKSKYRSWISILLVLRLCLLILFISNFLGDPSINLFAITAVVIFMSCLRVLFGTFYTNWILDSLELFFIMNVGIFSVSTLYVLNTSGNQRALADTLVGVAFIVFAAIIVYHSWRQLSDSRWWRHTLKPKLQRYFNSSKSKENLRTQEVDEVPQSRPQVLTTFIDLREPLLDSS